MIRTNKKLYYKYFDLMRVSKFLNDKDLSLRAESVLSIIQSNNNTDLISLSPHDLHNIGFDKVTIEEIAEYRKTKEILSIRDYVNRLDKWIRLLILPDFFNLQMISRLFKEEKIGSKEQLTAYFMSKKSEEQFGKDKSELFAYFVQNMDGGLFPHEYRKKYSKNDCVSLNVSGTKIWGNFHNHTPYSDGRCSIKELKDMAKSYDRTYIGISDHTKRVKGVDEDTIIEQHHEIEELNSLDDNFVVLKSLECEILYNGELDISDEYLNKCDYIIAAVHSDTCMTKAEATKRVLKAVDNSYTNILAHPSSRIYQKNIGLFLDMHKIIDACVANNVAIEINGDADRLDLDPRFIMYALNKGAFFTVDSDTHSIEGFRSINNAIRIAEDYHIPPERILNTYNRERLNILFQKR